MRVIAKKHLTAYWVKHPDAEQPLKAWYDEATKAQWLTPQEIKAQYGSASFVGNNRVVFNIKGNNHRLIVAVAYRFGALYIKFVGTHSEYDKVNAATVEME
jgi:mRNA interferase HigB